MISYPSTTVMLIAHQMFRPNGITSKSPRLPSDYGIWRQVRSTSGEHGWGPHTRDILDAVSSIVIIYERPGEQTCEGGIEHAIRFPDSQTKQTTTTHDNDFRVGNLRQIRKFNGNI